MSLLRTTQLTKRFGGLTATDRLDLEVRRGEVHAVIGPNGAGKTTLVNQIVGELAPDGGAIEFDGQDITRLPTFRRARLGLSRSYQITSVFPEFSALENVAIAAQAHRGHSFGFWRPAVLEEELTLPSEKALSEVGLAAKAGARAAELAHGERRQLEIAMALVSSPKLLLLDEPMAGMGRHESGAMVRLLSGLKSTYAMLLIEHDMDAVFALADRVTVLVYGRAIASGAPADIRANAEVRRAYLGERYVAR
ncbi:MAG: ABC transporter ATP-binding protein [Betaproteobacteria bacterium]